MSTNSETDLSQTLEDIQKNSGSIIVMGGLMFLLGIFAMTSPLAAGVSLALTIGIMLLVGGVSQLVFAFKAGKGLWAIILTVLTILIGGYMISRPGLALASFTLFLAIYLVLTGIAEIIMSFQFKPAKGWGWITISGILSLLLGVLIWNQFPLSGAWAIGILIGIRLFFTGLTFLLMGIAGKSMKTGVLIGT